MATNREMDQLSKWADGLVTETQRLQGIEQRAEQAEAKLARVAEVIALYDDDASYVKEIRAALAAARDQPTPDGEEEDMGGQ